MSVKGKLPDLFTFRNILIILIAVLIIVAAIIFITSEPVETVDVLTVKEVLDTPDKYYNSGNITIQAYYYEFDKEGSIFITDSLQLAGSNQNIPQLPVDHSRIENLSIDEGNRYHFTGVLIEDTTGFLSSPKLIAYKIEE